MPKAKFNMMAANCVVTLLYNAFQILVWLPLLSAYGLLCGVVFNVLSCFRESNRSSSSMRTRLPYRIAGWCKQGPQGFGGSCGGVDVLGRAMIACQSESDKDDEFHNCAQMCFGLCSSFGWAMTIALSLPGCLLFTLRQVCTAAPAAQSQQDENGNALPTDTDVVASSTDSLGSAAQNAV